MPDLNTVHVLRLYVLLLGPIIGAVPCAVLLSVYVVLRRMAYCRGKVSRTRRLAGFASRYSSGIGYRCSDGLLWIEIIAGIFFVWPPRCSSGYVTKRETGHRGFGDRHFPVVTSVALGETLLRVRSYLERLRRPTSNRCFSGTSSTPAGMISSWPRLRRSSVFLIIFSLYYQFLYTTLDEEMARINGVNTRLINTLLLVMISLVIVVCVRMVGSLIITALMIIPGTRHLANMISRKFTGVLVGSLIIGTLGTSVSTGLAACASVRHAAPIGPDHCADAFSDFRGGLVHTPIRRHDRDTAQKARLPSVATDRDR